MFGRFFFAAAAVFASATGAHADAEPYVSEIFVFGTNFCPQGYAAADGSVQAIQSNMALFSLLGTYYGGNGQTTYGLPTVKTMAAPANSQPAQTMTTCIATNGIFPPRQ